MLPLTIQQHAVVFGVLAAYVSNGERMESIHQAANKFLSKLDISPLDEIGSILSELELEGLLKQNSSGVFEILHKPTKPHFKGKEGFERMVEQLNGKIIHLRYQPLVSEKKENYDIEFNVDGKGSTKLPDGSVVNKPLGALARDTSVKFELTRADHNLGVWSVIHERHPELTKVRKSRTNLREYINLLLTKTSK